MSNYLDIIKNAYSGYFNYLWNDITHPSWNSYFYWLLLVSIFFFALEIVIPWRKNQAVFRKDFWMDFFYMFFNFFLFSLIIYNAASYVIVTFFSDSILNFTGIDINALNPMVSWPHWAILLIGFIIRDFVQWNTHRLLHRSSFLWEFHKVHHSVAEMGFAAHLRYHWMETIVYRTIEYLPLALLGIPLHDFFIIHIFSLAVGHYNHSNISISTKVTGGIFGGLVAIMIAYGVADIPLIVETVLGQLAIVAIGILIGVLVFSKVMRHVFNSPEMHIWHHAKNLPEDKRYGVNFGLSLAIWDYLFGTDYIPETGRDIPLGFSGVEAFPEDFLHQVTYGFKKK